jgi:CHAD domain-containing protein
MTSADPIQRNAAVLASAIARARRGAPRGVHRARVATRRLREALARAAAAGAGVGAERRALRRLGRALGPVREMDVVRMVLADAARRFQWLPTVVARVDAHCLRRREAAYQEFEETLVRIDLPAVIGRILEAADRDARRPGNGLAAEAHGRRLRRRAREVKQALRRAGTLYAQGPLHELRIATKKLRYVLELGAPPGRESLVRADIATLRRLQSALGHLHDLQTVQHQLQDVASHSKDRRVVRLIEAMHRDLETECRRAHARLVRGLPRVQAMVAALLEGGPTAPAIRRIRPAGIAGLPVSRARVRLA